MKKKIALSLAAMMAATQLAMAAPQEQPSPLNNERAIAEMRVIVAMANPWTDHASMAEAQEAVGVKLDIPSDIDRGIPTDFRTIGKDKTLEVIYRDATGKETARIRKAPGNRDISGNYVGYTSLERVAIGRHMATIKGFDRNFTLAIWEDNGYSYSVSLDKPISRTGMRHLLADIK